MNELVLLSYIQHISIPIKIEIEVFLNALDLKELRQNFIVLVIAIVLYQLDFYFAGFFQFFLRFLSFYSFSAIDQ